MSNVLGAGSRPFYKRICAVSLLALLVAGTPLSSFAQASVAGVPQQIAGLQPLSDDQFLTELEKLQLETPEAAQSLADAAKAQRPHLAAGIDQLMVSVMGPNYALALALGVGVGTAAAIVVANNGPSTTTVETVLPPLAPGWETDNAFWETAEYLVDYSKPAINASAAYARGGTGDGITVAVFDTGLYGDHDDIAANVAGCFKTLTGENSLDTTFCEDDHGHGTHVAGTIAGVRDGIAMHGVAFDAKILSVNMMNAVGGMDPGAAAYTEAMRWAIENGAVVSNHSYGIPGRHDLADEALRDAVIDTYGGAIELALRNNHIMVWANGNDAHDEPGIEAALPLYEPDLLRNWVAVTSINPDGTRSSYAQSCGMAAAWCIAAPGGDDDDFILSLSTSQGTYADKAGTSMAAPQVTGALAVLIQLFGPGTISNLTPQQIVQIMFKTADKDLPGYNTSLDVNGLSTVFGHGALDLDNASTPAKHTLSLSGHAVLRSGFGVNGAVGGTLKAQLSEQTLAVFDNLGRGVTVNLDSFSSQTGVKFDYQDAMRRLGKRDSNVIELASGMTLEFTQGGGGEFDPARAQMHLMTEIVEGTHLIAGTNASPQYSLGFFNHHDLTPNDLVDASALSAPYLALADHATTAGLQSEFGHGQLTVLAFGGEAMAVETGVLGDEMSSWTYGTAAEWQTEIGDTLGLSVRGGLVAETKDLLGSQFTGAFALGGTTTSFIGAGIRYSLTPDLEIVGSYDLGWSSVATSQGSLVTRVDPLMSDAFSLGLVGRNAMITDDRFGVIVSQPMRLGNGGARLSLPQSRMNDGSLAYKAADIDLVPDGQELRLQGFYTAPAMGGALSLGAMVRFEPNHVAGAPTDVAGMASFNQTF